MDENAAAYHHHRNVDWRGQQRGCVAPEPEARARHGARAAAHVVRPRNQQGSVPVRLATTALADDRRANTAVGAAIGSVFKNHIRVRRGGGCEEDAARYGGILLKGAARGALGLEVDDDRCVAGQGRARGGHGVAQLALRAAEHQSVRVLTRACLCVDIRPDVRGKLSQRLCCIVAIELVGAGVRVRGLLPRQRNRAGLGGGDKLCRSRRPAVDELIGLVDLRRVAGAVGHAHAQ